MQEVNFNKIILKTAITTIISLLILAIISLSLFTYFSPVTLARVASSLGLDNTSIFYYELAYDKSEDINDLYNLLNKTIAVSNEEKIINNFELLYNNGSQNYYNFIAYINQFNLNSTTNNNLKLYLTNEDARLKSRYVTALTRQNFNSVAINFALADLNNENITSINSPINFIINAYFSELISIDASNEFYTQLENYVIGTDPAINLIDISCNFYNNTKIIYLNELNLLASQADRFNMAVFANSLIKIASTLKTLSTKVTC